MGSISNGWALFKDMFRILRHKPIFLLPIFCCWLFVAAITFYCRYYFAGGDDFVILFLKCYLVICSMVFTLCLSNIIMLEFMEQVERGQPISFGKALYEAFILDFFKVIPIAIVWSLLWFLIFVLRAMTKSRDSDDDVPEPSAEDFAKTIGGANEPFSWAGLGLDLIEKLIRMTVFLCLPAIAWENKGSFSAVKSGFRAIRNHPGEFLTSFSLTELASIIIFLPPGIIFLLDAKFDVNFPPYVWHVVIFYIGVGWTLSIYMEQMSCALLYLWHLKWEKNGAKGSLADIARPDLLDDVYEITNLESVDQESEPDS